MKTTKEKTKLGRIYDLTVEITKYKDKNILKFFEENFQCRSDIEALKILIEIIEELENEKNRLKELDNVSINKHISILDVMIRNYRRIRLDNPSVEWKNFTDGITGANSTTLLKFEFIKDILNEQGFTQVVDADSTLEIIKLIDELTNEITQEDLPLELKDFALKQLGALREALYKYTYYGSDDIQREIDAVLGAVSRHSKDSKHDSKTTKPLYDKIFNCWIKAYTLVSSVTNTPQLIESVQEIVETITG